MSDGTCGAKMSENSLTVLQDRLSTVTISTSEASRLRRRREQLTAELDAWSYLAKTARSPR